MSKDDLIGESKLSSAEANAPVEFWDEDTSRSRLVCCLHNLLKAENLNIAFLKHDDEGVIIVAVKRPVEEGSGKVDLANVAPAGSA